jgi:hypothetical protein
MVQRLRAIVRSTPGRLTVAMMALLVLGIAYGVTAFTGSAVASSHVTSVKESSGPLTVSAQSLYRALSDADATAATAFLSPGAETTVSRRRYLDDIAAAGAALARVTSGVTGSSAAASAASTKQLDILATELPVYTGLVETARANNRLGYPVGAAYLREASGLMRTVALPAAQKVYENQTQRLQSDHDSGARYPYVAIALGIVALGSLVLVQRYLTRRTHRFVNPGLAIATLGVLAALIYQNVAWFGLHSHLDSAQANGSTQVQMLATARINALQARADEALTLVARGSGGTFEQDFKTTMGNLVGTDGTSGLLGDAAAKATDPAVLNAIQRTISDVRAWQEVHTTLRADDDGGKYTAAVDAATGTASTIFTSVDNDLAAGIQASDVTFNDQAVAAGRTVNAVGIVVVILTLLTLAGAAVGIQRRIAEYR